MCLAIPMKLVSKEDDFGVVEYMGVSRKASLHLVDNVKEGDFLIIHAGFAIRKIDPDEAKKTIAMLEDILETE